MTRGARLIMTLLAGLVIAMYVGSIQAALITPQQDTSTVGIPTLTEQDPDITDCYEEGNRICGDKDGVMEEQAWATWDSIGGWKYLKVDPNRSFKVEYVGTAMVQPQLGEGEVALPSSHSGGYYVFRATYTQPML